MRDSKLVISVSILAGALWASDALALSCADSAVSVLPADGRLAVGQRIMFYGYGRSERLVTDLARLSPRLEGPAGSVPLNVVATFRGRAQSNALLEVGGRLVVGAWYRLLIDGARDRELEVHWRSASVPIVFRVVEAKIPPPPKWTGPPRAEKATEFWGTSFHVATPLEGAESILIRAEVTEVESKSVVGTFLLRVTDSKIQFGSAGCGAEFNVVGQRKYHARLTALDLFGHEAPAPGRGVELVASEP